MAETLWNKGKEATQAVEDFTVGNDRILDMRLAAYDVQGSMAHIKMLESIGLLTADELERLTAGLEQILSEINAGNFRLEDSVEDIHSQVELLLTRRLGEIGKKIHSGRSRNDQVLVDVKLFLKDEILKLKDRVLLLFDILQELSEKYRDVLLYMLRGAYNVADQNPLGSAAGYGSSFPLDREMTTELLGFGSMEYNSVAAQLSRGKSERAVASAIGAIALTLNKFAADCCMYMCPNYGFISFPDELTTGSSIMPHKKNPDVWEIMRGNCNRIMNAETEISMLCSNMPHGYHRDFQLLKDILFPKLELMHKCLAMAHYMLCNIRINENILKNHIYDYLFTVEEVNRRVLSGTPFRDAYKAVGIEVNDGTFRYGNGKNPEKAGDLHHTHIGSTGNLATERIREKMEEASGF